MKTHSLLLLCGILGIATGSAAAPPPKLEIASHGPLIGLTAMDRENGSWILQSSPDLKQWTDVGSPFIIRNSFLPLLPPPQEGRKLYYRLNEAYLMPHRDAAAMLDLPATPYPYAEKAKISVTNAAMPGGNVSLQDPKVLLGRVLFYDRRLSKDNSVSCASCHRQENSFADKVAFSSGHLGGQTVRNSAAPIDVASYSTKGPVFWDGRNHSLESAVLEPISNLVEMGLSQEELVAKLSLEPYYAEMFKTAFGTAEVTAGRIGIALAQFCNAIPRFNSKFDQAVRMHTATFTTSEQQGYSIFGSKCMICHVLTGSTRSPFANNGLDVIYADQGVGAVTGLTRDQGMFKIPTLRQVSQTGPYMHDGRFDTLRKVIDHYSEGIKSHPNLSSPLKSSGPMHLTEDQKQALEDFLKTLTDPEIATNPAFADPFRKN